MPLKIVPPKAGRSPFYFVRGTYLGVAVYRSTKTTEKRVADRIKHTWAKQIERGEYKEPGSEKSIIALATANSGVEAPVSSPLARRTFLEAIVAYLKAGGDGRFIEPIIEMKGPNSLNDKLLTEIDQIVLDTAAAELYPHGSAPTLNRNFYTPVLAVIHRAGVEKQFKRPKGWRGTKATSWLEPDQAFRLIAKAYELDAEFGLFCLIALYTGMRLSDLLSIRLGWMKLNIKRAMIYLPKTKNSEPRAVYLPKPAVEALKGQPPPPIRDKIELHIVKRRPRKKMTPHMIAAVSQGLGSKIGPNREDAGMPFLDRHPEKRLFRFHAGGYLRGLLKTAMKNAKLSFPRRQCGFHIFCHTYGTWLDRYGGLDAYAMTRTDRWKDPRSADRYRHGEVSEESLRADLFPTPELDAAIRAESVQRDTETS
jgi:integrase